MGLVNKLITSKLNKNHQQLAKKLNYKIVNDEITLSQEEFVKYFSSERVKIEFICDKCKRTFNYDSNLVKRKYDNNEFLCKKCIREKHTLELTNGKFSHTSQISEVKQKYVNTTKERYGEEYVTPSQSPIVKKHQQLMTKIKCQEKYGCDYDNFMQVPEVKEKRVNTVRKKYKCDHIMQSEDVKEKRKATTRQRYNYDWTAQVPEIRHQQLETTKQRFNYDGDITSVFQIPQVREKIKKTCLDRYGKENVLAVPEIIEKIHRKKKTFVSKQQKHICELINGTLNYVFNKYYLDIALVDEKIDIEYDGGGHELNVQLGLKTREQFDNHEKGRTHVILKNGWKMIRLIAPHDKLLDDNDIIKIITWSKKWLLNHSTHIIYAYLEENRIKSSAFDLTITDILEETC